VATDDAIFVFLPEYPKPDHPGDGTEEQGPMLQHQYGLYLRASDVLRPEPAVNRKLCAFAGVALPPPDDGSAGDENLVQRFGHGPVTSSGGSLSQVVRLEWSPDGLGENLRPLLTAMLSSGQLLIMGEHVDRGAGAMYTASMRNTNMWKMLWGLGAGLPLPSEDHKGMYRTMDEYIASFSWANKVAAGQALLAYANDEGEVTIMSVQRFPLAESNTSAPEDMWQVQEVARFDASGPHGVSEEGLFALLVVGI
jgi:hypothetical protein